MLLTPLHIPATFHDVPSKIEGVIPEHRNVHYVYYNKMYFVCKMMTFKYVFGPLIE